MGPSTPAGLSTTPASPANENNPEVKGSAEAGSTVRVYKTDNCTGPFVTGTATQFGGGGYHDLGLGQHCDHDQR